MQGVDPLRQVRISLLRAILTRAPENVAFLIRHNQGGYGKRIEPTDVSFATKNWAAKTTGNGLVGIGVFVNGSGFSHTIVRATLGKDDDVIEKLGEQAEKLLQQFFPGI